MIIMKNNITKELFMLDQILFSEKELLTITPEVKCFLNHTRTNLKGTERRQFMARVVLLMGKGGQTRAKTELGWDRDTIRKGTKELETGIICIDNFQGRGRKGVEKQFPNLLEDIKSTVEPSCQTDPTFRSTQLYSPITAKEVHRRLIEQKGYIVSDRLSNIFINYSMLPLISHYEDLLNI